MPAESEVDRIDPQPTVVKLSTGFPVEVVRLQLRQLFRLLRILTHGAGPALAQLDFSTGQEEFGAKLLGMVLMAIPDAEQETIGFLQSMLQPAGLVSGINGKRPAQLSKKEREDDQALWEHFNEELHNPNPFDFVDILEVIIVNEAPDLQSLGKKLRHLWEVAQKAGNFGKPAETPEGAELQLPEPMPNSSISSPTSTGGPTSTSSASPSAESASARRRRAAVTGESS